MLAFFGCISSHFRRIFQIFPGEHAPGPPQLAHACVFALAPPLENPLRGPCCWQDCDRLIVCFIHWIFTMQHSLFYSLDLQYGNFFLQCLAFLICGPCFQHSGSKAVVYVSFSSWMLSLPLSSQALSIILLYCLCE